MDKQIDKIREDLHQLCQQEYQKNNYQPTKTSAKELKNPLGFKEKEVDAEVSKLEGKVKMMISKNEKKGKIAGEPEPQDFMDNTSDMFTIVDSDKEYLEWRKLEIDRRLEILENYFNAFEEEIDAVVKQQLRVLVGNQKLLYKKDINYDKVNEKIISITLLKKIDGKYVLKETVKKVSARKQNQSHINKLLKKT